LKVKPLFDNLQPLDDPAQSFWAFKLDLLIWRSPIIAVTEPAIRSNYVATTG
jgi:hypothetical protein